MLAGLERGDDTLTSTWRDKLIHGRPFKLFDSESAIGE